MSASSSVIGDLSLWGPQGSASPPSLLQAQRYCRKLATSHYENFPVVSIFLPQHLHQHFYNVYAYCRWADDLGDEVGNRDQSLELLDWWREELERCYAGKATHPVFIALTATIEEFRIPQAPFADLISAFVQDQSILQYDHFEQLLAYCELSANPVGRIVLHLCERFNAQNAALSDSICTGLQLANFWQDVARDDDMGRVYIPREDRKRFDYREEDLKNRRTTPQFIELMKYEVDRARLFLLAGRPLVKKMPGRLKLDIDLFIRGGLLILDGIEKIDYRVWQQRPVIRKSQFAGAGLRSIASLLVRSK